MRAGTAQLLSLFFTWILIIATRVSVQGKTPYVAQPVATEKASDCSLPSYPNITYPTEYEEQILYALSYYPDLHQVKIVFKEKNITTTLNCKPRLSSLLLGKNRRIYVIGINKKKHFKGIHFNEIPKEGQIGIIGHELAHIQDYHSKGVLGIIKRGVEYLHASSKERFEKSIDRITIQAGLGKYLYRWADYAVNESDATESYKKFKRKIYLEPEEIVTENGTLRP